MMRFIMPIVLIGIAIGVFAVFTNPLYSDIKAIRVKAASYNQALANSKALESERDKLTQKYNAFNPEDRARLQKLLPQNIDNIRLILEIEQLALPYGMTLKNVKYNTTSEEEEEGGLSGAGTKEYSHSDYGVWDLEFSTTGTYNNFLNFVRDLESNLRIVDIATVEFSSDTDLRQGPGNALGGEAYRYDFKIKTYWLRN